MNTLTTGDKSLTVAGKFMGKPEYAAPELVLGDISHQNQTTDIYSVGILLYQCIIGHTPFEGARHEILEMQLKAKLPLGKIKSKALRNIIATACDKKQELRYQTSAQMRVALETMNGSKRAMTTKRKVSLIAAAVAVIFVLFSIAFIVKHKQDAAKQEAEIMRIEQLRQEALSSITSIVDEADRLEKMGLSKEDENYEQQLMDAFSSYKKAENMALQNVSLGYPTEKLESKKNDILIALDSAKCEMTKQASLLSEMGEEEMAKNYSERVKVVENFINANKEKNENND